MSVKKNKLRILGEYLNEIDMKKIESWYNLIGGNKNVIKALYALLQKELNLNIIYLKSVEPIDDITLLIIDENNNLSLISLVLNTDKESNLVLTSNDFVKNISFLLIPKTFKDKIVITENTKLENNQIYRDAYKKLLHKVRNHLQSKKNIRTKYDRVNLLREIKELCIQIQDFSLLGEYYIDEEKCKKY